MSLPRLELNDSVREGEKIFKRQDDVIEPLNENTLYLFFKRLTDLLLSVLGLILLTPVFLIVSILIKLDNPAGKVIFSQRRVGENGKEFIMYKFRSMVPDAERLLENLLDRNETSGLMFKLREDPRVTRIGRFIRKTSIDELPQLFNVLKGEMSLVGPRPPIPREVCDYSAYDRQRLLVRPGCTGPWQVSGRSTVGFDEMVALDLHYIYHRSWATDAKLIVQTVFVLFGSKNAY